MRGFSAYTLAIFLPRALRLVTIPLIVRAVSMQTYGVFALLSLAAMFLQMACDFGMGTAALRLAVEQPAGGRGSLFATLFWSRALGASAAALGLWLVSPHASRLLLGSSSDASSLALMGPIVLCGSVSSGCIDQLRSEGRHTAAAHSVLLGSVVETCFTVAWVVGFGRGLAGLVWGRLSGDVAAAIVLLWACRGTLGQRWDSRLFRSMARLGAPIAFLSLLGALREMDRYLVKMRLGIPEVGQYDLALRIVGPVALGNLALSMVFEPYAYRTFQAPAAGEMMGLFVRVYAAAFSTLAFGLSLLAPEIVPLLAPNVGAAAIVAPTLLFAFVAQGLRRACGLGVNFAKRTDAWAAVAMSEAVISLSFAYYALPKLKILAAGLGFLLGAVVSSIIGYALARRVYDVKLPLGRALFLVLLGAGASTWAIGGVTGDCSSLPLRLLGIPIFLLTAWHLAGLELQTLRLAIRSPLAASH
jgi:O-antigen/teichoic acid export membrane protein